VVGVELLAANNVASAQSYDVTLLTPLGGETSASGVNDSGQISGLSDDAAVLWNGGGAPTIVGPSYGSPSSGNINDVGQIAGGSANSAVIWTSTTTTVLPPLPGVANGYGAATAINSLGQSVGYTANGNTQVAVSWTNGKPTVLAPAAGFQYSSATALNNVGQSVGVSQTELNSLATIWNGSTPSTLAPLDGNNPNNQTGANGINNAGQVVGFGYGVGPGTNNSNFTSDVPVLWNTGTSQWKGSPNSGTGKNSSSPVLLQSLVVLTDQLGFSTSQAGEANAINDAGQVVGFSCLTSPIAGECGNALHAVLWNNSVAPTDLNTYLTSSQINAGWELESATAISNNGIIVGNDYNTLTNQLGAFEMTPLPTPLPAAGWLLLSGLGLIAASKRTRTQRPPL